MTEEWFVVQTQPRSEAKAQFHLDRQGIETYLPQILMRRRHARKVEVVRAPLFPRYLFVSQRSAMRCWRSIRSTFGVSQLVCTGDMPAVISQRIVDDLRGREEGGIVKLGLRSFKPGDKVRFLEGSFADAIGIYEGMRDEERVSVLLDMLGRKVRVLVDELALGAA